jgi:hypothetical protein
MRQDLLVVELASIFRDSAAVLESDGKSRDQNFTA